ncbi:Rossmann-like and DUF2520 domain-containing protein [Chitinimonas sp. BJB300]|uniref:Rossmann-like and DUF2520 domain-containing protein n=1 Tax=Chitinimonas sp. BJB300 TaxID=1559339 RepID=UPI000C0D83F2|nr:Rossmann-like and DUF2520 domain-containing protein [Chitinimonas sp. BJB300]PHV10711.1 oxidoreductase [Chitinimonas sp. BJB300]TSJ89782.1 DUF2520 domain-containing protein [Chitinimonas sp. BJB300]
MRLPTLNLLGPGRLGRSLAYLWQQTGVLQIQDIVSRDITHSQQAVTFIGAGHSCALDNIRPADFTLVATSDDVMADAVAALAAKTKLRKGDVIFHCSGALPSTLLIPLKTEGVGIASIHPLASFATPETAVKQFSGTFCGCEGDAAALTRLGPIFDAIGAQRFIVDPAQKTLYHAGAVLACNDLVALMEAALRCMAAAGIARDIAWQALRQMAMGTLNNLDNLTPAQALTGPIARGDATTVTRQMAATQALDANVAATYRTLGQMAMELAASRPVDQGRLNPNQIAALQQALRQEP